MPFFNPGQNTGHYTGLAQAKITRLIFNPGYFGAHADAVLHFKQANTQNNTNIYTSHDKCEKAGHFN